MATNVNWYFSLILYFYASCSSCLSVSIAKCVVAKREGDASETRGNCWKLTHTTHRPQQHERYVCVASIGWLLRISVCQSVCQPIKVKEKERWEDRYHFFLLLFRCSWRVMGPPVCIPLVAASSMHMHPVPQCCRCSAGCLRSSPCCQG